jgi:hypothetical protein
LRSGLLDLEEMKNGIFYRRRKLFKEKEAIQIRNKAKIIYRKTTALIKSLRRRA